MSLPRKNIFIHVAKVFVTSATLVLFAFLLGGTYLLGFDHGKLIGSEETEIGYSSYISSLLKTIADISRLTPTPVPVSKSTTSKPTELPQTSGLLKNVNWGGPDLWTAVNKRRQEFGVNPLNQKDNLCTIASIRLNQLLELGKLDGHEGFSTMTEKRPDLKPIFESYSTIAEFLAAGGDSATETVSLWENSLGHKKLLTGGEYVWGCIYAQNSFAVAITAY